MDAIPADAIDLSYSDSPPMLLVASSDLAMARADRSAITSGYRIAGRVPLELAGQRLDEQISAVAVWVELDRDGGTTMDELLQRVSSDVADVQQSFLARRRCWIRLLLSWRTAGSS